MAGETIITIVGNLTADPEIRTTGSGASVASFTIASTPRTCSKTVRLCSCAAPLGVTSPLIARRALRRACV